jgi:hypothetical protein
MKEVLIGYVLKIYDRPVFDNTIMEISEEEQYMDDVELLRHLEKRISKLHATNDNDFECRVTILGITRLPIMGDLI